jgi:protein TonB
MVRRLSQYPENGRKWAQYDITHLLASVIQSQGLDMLPVFASTPANHTKQSKGLNMTMRRAIGVAVLLAAMATSAEAQIAPTTGPEAMTASPAMRAWRQHTTARIMRTAKRLAEAGLRGRVVICLAVNRSGRVVEATVLRSSGNTELDGAALAVVRMAGPFAPLPSIYPKAVLAVGVPIAYSGPSSHGGRAARLHGT